MSAMQDATAIFFQPDPFTVLADILFIGVISSTILLTIIGCIIHHKWSYHNTDKPLYLHVPYYFISIGSTYSQIIFTIFQLHQNGITLIDLLCSLFILIPFSISIIYCAAFIFPEASSNPSNTNSIKYLTTSNKIYFCLMTILSIGFYPAIIISSCNLFHLSIFSFILHSNDKHTLNKYRFFTTTILQDIPLLIIGLDLSFNKHININIDSSGSSHSGETTCYIMMILTTISILLSFIKFLPIIACNGWCNTLCCFFCNFTQIEKLKMNVRVLSSLAHFNDDESESLLFQFCIYHKQFTYHHQYIINTLKLIISSSLSISPKSFEIFGTQYLNTNDQNTKCIEFWLQLFVGKMLLYTEKNDIAEFADIKSKILSLTTYNESETNISNKLSLQFVNNLCEDLNFDNYNMNIAINYLSDINKQKQTLTVPSILSTPNTFSANTSIDKSTPHIKTLIRPKTPDILTLDQIVIPNNINKIHTQLAQYSPNSSAQPSPEPHVTPPSNNYNNNYNNNQQVKLQMSEMVNNKNIGTRMHQFSMSESAMSDDIYGPGQMLTDSAANTRHAISALAEMEENDNDDVVHINCNTNINNNNNINIGYGMNIINEINNIDYVE